MISIYKNKSANYFSNIRNDLISEIDFGPNIILEVGCGNGATIAKLKADGHAIFVAGIEMVAKKELLEKNIIDKIIIGNIEEIELPFEEGFFDIIILGDVLEHLIDPWSTLDKLKKYVKINGKIIISMPNVRNWRVLLSLIFMGNWDYNKSGILDKTHLRFFTKNGMKLLIKNSNLKLIKIYPANIKGFLISKLKINFLEEYLTSQYIIVAVKD
jgi:2-polyprenyl-3-methyl-5-hydroxy-6-metoxy-1,4-benzoquinol methylase